MLGRHPPGAYLRDPDLAAGDRTSPTEATFPTSSTLQPGEPVQVPPAVRHHLPTFPPQTLVLPHTSTQTTPTHFTTNQIQQTDFEITPLLFHEEQQTTPRPDTCHTPTQTDIHAIVRYPSFAAPKAVTAGSIPTSPSTPPEPTAAPPNTSAANKQPLAVCRVDSSTRSGQPATTRPRFGLHGSNWWHTPPRPLQNATEVYHTATYTLHTRPTL